MTVLNRPDWTQDFTMKRNSSTMEQIIRKFWPEGFLRSGDPPSS
jgi:hypothetical protein